MDPHEPVRDDDGVHGWFEGKRWRGARAFVWVAWVVTALLLALCVMVMLLNGHSTPYFNF
ncbi:hypothetical protein FR943_20180 [Mycobacterium sp. TNTM28]|uniref:Uncharacterized protein n=1 Tax=[Mycobacterium] fortunisiensis TaxID=2600579 RepID=A0ABS6KRQ6_9MYCO|nr:hypothetical protein [[Mycobacterium] fortunisiensis]MBU9766148.1 hypothetical protein [[Mycobacterium] fortunisiensis]